MTADECFKKGLVFSAVHDSFWTHACDIDEMNSILREQFTELYSKPILEDLAEDFKIRFPIAEFPPVPKRGTLLIDEVKKSPYFFA